MLSDDSSGTGGEPLYQGIAESETKVNDISIIRKEAEIAALKKELAQCRNELTIAQKTVFAVEDSEKELKSKLAEEKHKTLTLERMVNAIVYLFCCFMPK